MATVIRVYRGDEGIGLLIKEPGLPLRLISMSDDLHDKFVAAVILRSYAEETDDGVRVEITRPVNSTDEDSILWIREALIEAGGDYVFGEPETHDPAPNGGIEKSPFEGLFFGLEKADIWFDPKQPRDEFGRWASAASASFNPWSDLPEAAGPPPKPSEGGRKQKKQQRKHRRGTPMIPARSRTQPGSALFWEPPLTTKAGDVEVVEDWSSGTPAPPHTDVDLPVNSEPWVRRHRKYITHTWDEYGTKIIRGVHQDVTYEILDHGSPEGDVQVAHDTLKQLLDEAGEGVRDTFRSRGGVRLGLYSNEAWGELQDYRLRLKALEGQPPDIRDATGMFFQGSLACTAKMQRSSAASVSLTVRHEVGHYIDHTIGGGEVHGYYSDKSKEFEMLYEESSRFVNWSSYATSKKVEGFAEVIGFKRPPVGHPSEADHQHGPKLIKIPKSDKGVLSARLADYRADLDAKCREWRRASHEEQKEKNQRYHEALLVHWGGQTVPAAQRLIEDLRGRGPDKTRHEIALVKFGDKIQKIRDKIAKLTADVVVMDGEITAGGGEDAVRRRGSVVADLREQREFMDFYLSRGKILALNDDEFKAIRDRAGADFATWDGEAK